MEKIKSFTLLVLFGFAAVGLSISSARAQADVILNVDGGGNLTGAQNVVVDGKLYDVTLGGGSCDSLFDGCNPANFDFSEADGLGAAQALVDQVFIDSAAGLFDTDPELTSGCTSTANCQAIIPFDAPCAQFGGDCVNLFFAENMAGIGGKRAIGPGFGLASDDVTGFPQITYADFLFLMDVVFEDVAPDISGEVLLQLAFDPTQNQVLDILDVNSADPEAAILRLAALSEGFTESLQLENIGSMDSANATEGYSELFKIGMGFVEGIVVGEMGVGEVNFALKALLGEKSLKDLALEIEKKGAEKALGKVAGKVAGTVLTLGELAGNISIVIFEELQVSNEQAGINEVFAFQSERIRDATNEAQDTLRARNIDDLSSLSPLARLILRGLIQDSAVQILTDIASTQRRIENSTSEGQRRILANSLDGLNERAPFLITAAIGE